MEMLIRRSRSAHGVLQTTRATASMAVNASQPSSTSADSAADPLIPADSADAISGSSVARRLSEEDSIYALPSGTLSPMPGQKGNDAVGPSNANRQDANETSTHGEVHALNSEAIAQSADTAQPPAEIAQRALKGLHRENAGATGAEMMILGISRGIWGDEGSLISSAIRFRSRLVKDAEFKVRNAR